MLCSEKCFWQNLRSNRDAHIRELQTLDAWIRAVFVEGMNTPRLVTQFGKDTGVTAGGSLNRTEAAVQYRLRP